MGAGSPQALAGKPHRMDNSSRGCYFITGADGVIDSYNPDLPPRPFLVFLGSYRGYDGGYNYLPAPNVSNPLTTGRIDIRGLTPLYSSDSDSICSPFSAGTTGVVQTSSSPAACNGNPSYAWAVGPDGVRNGDAPLHGLGGIRVCLLPRETEKPGKLSPPTGRRLLEHETHFVKILGVLLHPAHGRPGGRHRKRAPEFDLLALVRPDVRIDAEPGFAYVGGHPKMDPGCGRKTVGKGAHVNPSRMSPFFPCRRGRHI